MKTKGQALCFWDKKTKPPALCSCVEKKTKVRNKKTGIERTETKRQALRSCVEFADSVSKLNPSRGDTL